MGVMTGYAEEVFRRQVLAFNSGDIDAFLETYSPEATVAGVGDEPLVGATALRRFYSRRFAADRTLRCSVLALAVFADRWVVAHELIAGRDGEVETVGVFDVQRGLIQRSSLLKG